MVIIFLCCITVLLLGVWEKKTHQKNVDAIPIRININGIRGKSTVTRLITGILTEANLQTVGKTTGTQARMIYWFTDEEEPIIRRPEGPNIREQKVVVQKAAELKAEALVSECMAVNPDYQIVFQEQMLQANVSVIVNVLEDHMDVMGPTLDEIAEAFTATIPYDGKLILSESPYVDYFTDIAKERRTEVIVVDSEAVSEEYLRKFEYMIFPENAALALGVADALGIDRETAMRGMLNAHPDPGAMRISPLGEPSTSSYFVNGFAANDAASTLNIWKRVEELGYPTNDPVIIMNCRADRVDRTEQFAKDVLPHMKIGTLVVVGETTSPITEAYENRTIEANKLLNLENYSPEECMNAMRSELSASNRMIYGIGNIHGTAEGLIEKLKELKVAQYVS